MEDLSKPFPDFDEKTYLKMNLDVVTAVQKEQFASGWEHFILYGFRENRPGVQPEIIEKVHNIWQAKENNPFDPFPPAHLRARVHGSEDLPTFEHVGRRLACIIQEVITSASIDLPENACLLDFGCGSARVIRHLQNTNSDWQFFGTDIDAEAIQWCQQNMAQSAEFVTNKEYPPLPFADHYFDFVYSISVFTHLPEDMQFAWLEELNRITKKGSYLLITIHGDELLQANILKAREDELLQANIKSRKDYPESGNRFARIWHYLRRKPKQKTKEILPTSLEQPVKEDFVYSVGGGTLGLPDFYQTTFHSVAYIRRNWSQYFEIVDIIEKGVARHQDIVICKKVK